jgi:hypothetical protein
MTGFCADCESLQIVDQADRATNRHRNWLCKEHPLPQRLNPVTGIYAADPPYRRCVDVRRDLSSDDCPDFVAGANQIHPRETAHDVHP